MKAEECAYLVRDALELGVDLPRCGEVQISPRLNHQRVEDYKVVFYMDRWIVVHPAPELPPYRGKVGIGCEVVLGIIVLVAFLAFIKGRR